MLGMLWDLFVRYRRKIKAEKSRIKILGIVASPRKGWNTDILVKEAMKAAEEAGNVETEILYLFDLKFGYCKGDLGCLKTKTCTQYDDDMNKLFKKLVDVEDKVDDALNKLDDIKEVVDGL